MIIKIHNFSTNFLIYFGKIRFLFLLLIENNFFARDGEGKEINRDQFKVGNTSRELGQEPLKLILHDLSLLISVFAWFNHKKSVGKSGITQIILFLYFFWLI